MQRVGGAQQEPGPQQQGSGSTALSLDGFKDEAMAILRDGVVSACNNGSLRTGGFYADLVRCTCAGHAREGVIYSCGVCS